MGGEHAAEERERREPPAGQQNRERGGPGSGTEGEQPDVSGKDVSPERPQDPLPAPDDDERADREAGETFPASDPPANY